MSEKSHGKRAEVPVDAIPKAQTWRPEAALASEVQNCGREQAGRMYIAVVRDAKMEIPDKMCMGFQHGFDDAYKLTLPCTGRVTPFRQEHDR